MELDVHLKRNNGDPWGFELTGGVDIPIKINKVTPSSPAAEAGLKEGDVMSKIQDVDTARLSLDAVMAVVEDVEDKMTIGVTRGLYDPVIDDQEPIYDTYEPGDFDPQSEPTEVQFKIQQFTQTPTLDANVGPKPVRPIPSTSSPLLQPEPIREPRPLTPYDESKQYRPFSTEPLPEVLPLEDPIILNPNYRDSISRSLERDDDVINKDEGTKETKFKLPLSDQYDPEGTKRKIEKKNDIIERKVIEVTEEMLKYVKTIEEKRNECLELKTETRDRGHSEKQKMTKSNSVIVQEQKESRNFNIVEEKKKEALKFLQKMRQEIDLAKIEETALNIIEENIERAVSVTEEIKREIDDVLSASVTPSIESEAILHKNYKNIYSKEAIETIDEIKKYPLKSEMYDKNVKTEEIIKEKNISAQNEGDSMKQDVIYEKRIEQSFSQSERDFKQQSDAIIKKEITHRNPPAPASFKGDIGRDIILEKQLIEKLLDIKQEDTKYDASPLHIVKNIAIQKECERSADQDEDQPSFVEPNKTEENLHRQQIATSAQKFDTKTMSRYNKEINSFSGNSNKQPQIDKSIFIESSEASNDMSLSNEIQQEQSSTAEREEKINKSKIRNQQEHKLVKENNVEKKHYNLPEQNRETRKSGAMMSQLYEKKSKDLTQKMDAVITEFQSKTTIDEQRDGRSRSRSQIEEEVMRETDPLEWLAKVDSRRTSQEREFNSRQQFSRKLESMSKKFETKHESRRINYNKPKPAKQMYVAIVESHVYTNKNAIFEAKAAKRSDVSSVQSTERVNTSYQTRESVFTENRSIISSDIREHTAKVVDTREIPLTRAKSETNIELVEKLEDNISNNYHKARPQTASATHQCKQVFVQEVQQIIEPIQKLPENVVPTKEIQSHTIKDQLSMAAAESIEITNLTEAKPLSVNDVKPEIGIMSSEKSHIALVITEVESGMSNLSDYMTLQENPTKPSVALDKQTAVEVSEIEVIDNNLTKLEVNYEKPKTIDSVGITEQIAYQVGEIESERTTAEVKIFEKHTDTAKMSAVTRLNNALQIKQIDDLKDDIHDLKLSVENPKKLDSIDVVGNIALTVNEIKADTVELTALHIVNENINTAVVDFIDSRDIALQITEIEAIEDDLCELHVGKEKPKTIQSIDFLPKTAIQVCETEVTKDELSSLNIYQEQPKEVNMGVDERKHTAIEISEFKSIKDELYSLETKQEKQQTIESIEYIPQTALNVTQVDLKKDELCELNTPKLRTEFPKLKVTEEKRMAIEICEIEPVKDDLAEFDIQKEKLQTIQSINFIEKVSLIVSEVDAEKDELSDIHLSMEKSQAAKMGIVEGNSVAVQINDIRPLTDDFAELNESRSEKHVVPSVDFIEQSAVQIVQVDAKKQEICELKVPQEKTEIAQTEITKKESKALLIVEIEPIKDDLAEFEIAKHKTADISLSMTKERVHALVISEVDAKKDEFTELNIQKQQMLDITPSLELGERSSAVQITEIESIRDEITEFDVLKPKMVDVSKSMTEIKSALLISEVETRQDEFTDLHTMKKQMAEVTTSMIARKSNAIQITEVETSQDEYAEINIKKLQLVDITPSLEVDDGPTAVQITEIESITDEIAELNLSKQKAMVVTESMVEKTPAIQISEVETRKDEFTELYLKKSKRADVSTSLTAKKLNAVQITEVETAQDEFAELSIRKQQYIDLTPSMEVDEESSAVQITEIESITDDMADLNISEEQTVDFTESIVDTEPTVHISEIETRKNESRKLHTIKHESVDVSASIKARKSKTHQTTQDEFVELSINKRPTIQASSSVEIEDDRSTSVEIIELDTEEDLSKHKVVQNGFAKSADVIKQQSNSLEISSTEAINTYTGLNYARRGIKKETIQSEINFEANNAAKVGIEVKQSRMASAIAQSKHETESVQITHKTSDNSHLASHRTESRNSHIEMSKQSKSAKSLHESTSKSSKKLTLQTDLSAQSVTMEQEVTSPSPPVLPPTPLTDEYIFRLVAPLPKSRSTTPIPPDYFQTPIKREDRRIVKKKLIPHIELTIERIIYDPPLPTPPEEKPCPIYTKPGLRGGTTYPYFYKEEIRDIEKKSSLLASAIDQTIKSIEEYKQEVGIEMKRETNQETSKSDYEYTSTKTITEHKMINEIIQNGDISTEKRIEREITESNNNKELTEGDNKAEENKKDMKEISKPTSDEHENFNKLETNIKISIEEETLPATAPAKTDHQETQKMISKETKEEMETAVEVIKPNEVNEVDKKDMNEISTTASDKHESLSQLETNIKISKEEETSPETAPAEADHQETNKTINKETKQEMETPVEIVKPNEVKEVEIIEEEEKETNNETQVKNETEKVDVTTANEEEINAEIPDTLAIEVKTATNEAKDIKSMEGKEVINENKTEDNQNKAECTDNKIENIESKIEEEKIDYLQFVKPVKFDPEAAKSLRSTPVPIVQEPITIDEKQPKVYVTDDGEILGTIKGIVDGLEEPVLDEEVAKELGKPGLPEEQIAELISGEADILREAHVMGLTRVISSHMHRAEDEEDLTIKPVVSSLKSSEVLKALNEEILQKKIEEEKRWTTFLQKPKRPVPRSRYGYQGYVEEKEFVEEPYKVVIVKQPKPKIAPDFKPEDFDTGPLPWEERAEEEALLPPVAPEEPILIPEEPPQFLEAVDPLPETEIPDLEDTGIPLPKIQVQEQPVPLPVIQLQEQPVLVVEESRTPENVVEGDHADTAVVKEPETMVAETEDNRLAEELVRSVQSMVDPNASLEQQLVQMKAQLAALAKLPGVIQQTLELVSKQLEGLSIQGINRLKTNYENESNVESFEEKNVEEFKTEMTNGFQSVDERTSEVEALPNINIEEVKENGTDGNEEEVIAPEIVIQEAIEKMKREEEARLEEEMRSEKQKKEFPQRESEPRQLTQRPSSRVGKPKPVFGPLNPEDRPLILPGGRKWRCPQDANEDQIIAELMKTNAEVIQGKAIGINFMKYEVPPVSLEHLKNSEVYKVVHNMDETPLKQVELLGPVIAEADYRKRCRSRTPNRIEQHNDHPPQFQP